MNELKSPHFARRIWRSLWRFRGRVRNQLIFRLGTRRRNTETHSSRHAELFIEDGTFHRYLYPLAKSLESGGYNVRVTISSKAVSAADVYVRLLLDDGLIHRVATQSGHPNRMTLHDESGVRTMAFDADYFGKSTAPRLPMPMHPLMYSRGLVHQASGLRANRERQIQVLFAGSQGSSDRLLKERFGVIPREDVLTHLQQSARVEHVLLKHHRELSHQYPDRVLLAIREVCDIPQDELLQTLSRARFFLALPGWIMPPAHNLTECMAVGAVPILQYGSLLPQPLTDGVNCLVYRSLSHLEEVILFALQMSASEAEKMSRQVIEYYDAYLSPEAVADAVRNCTSPTIGLVAEETSVSLLQ